MTILRYSIVLLIPILLILVSRKINCEFDVFLFAAVGISNLIVLLDINKEFSEETKLSIRLYIQLFILAIIISISFSFLVAFLKDYSTVLYHVMLYGAICILLLLILGIIILANTRKRHRSLVNYLLFGIIVLIFVPIWIKLKWFGYEAKCISAVMHLLFIPWFFLGFDGIPYLIQKVKPSFNVEMEHEKLKEFALLDIGLVLVGITTFFAAKESMIDFRIGSAAVILIIGNYFYLIIYGKYDQV